jgi:hypothetical protein
VNAALDLSVVTRTGRTRLPCHRSRWRRHLLLNVHAVGRTCRSRRRKLGSALSAMFRRGGVTPEVQSRVTERTFGRGSFLDDWRMKFVHWRSLIERPQPSLRDPRLWSAGGPSADSECTLWMSRSTAIRAMRSLPKCAGVAPMLQQQLQYIRVPRHPLYCTQMLKVG